MLQNRKGFTLIELMIVVAIIGILAAVAIPGFMTYIKNSKTSEAKTNLDAIKKGALAYYEAEHYDSTGMTAVSKQYPYSNSTLIKVGAQPTAKTIGQKQSPVAVDFGAMNDLSFKLTSPFYYSYAYIADGVAVTCEDKPDPADATKTIRVCTPDASGFQQSHFQATACASLNTEQDSIFYINGYSDGSVSPVIEGGKCYEAEVPPDPSAT